MVNDPRVSHQLARLGGVYRDPARVDRDTSILLKSSVGNHLQPITASYVDASGTSSNVLVLQGTIAIHFRGNTYQLLIDMYLVSGYPIRPPVCYVRLADSTMYLKQNHKHVGSDGKVYLPYLHEWSGTSHNLVELVVAMSSVFSAEPPVFSRPNRPAPPPPAPPLPPTTTTAYQPQPSVIRGSVVGQQQQQQQSSTSVYGGSDGLYNGPNSAGSRGAPVHDEHMMRVQLEAKLAQEADEANAAVEAARKFDAEEKYKREEEERKKRDEEERERRRKQQQDDARMEQEKWDRARTDEIRNQVKSKIVRYCQTSSGAIHNDVQQDWRDQQLLSMSTKYKVEDVIEQYKEQKKTLQQQLDIVAQKKDEIQLWLQEHSDAEQEQQELHGTTNNGSRRAADADLTAADIDNIVVPDGGIVHEQMLTLAAENAALQDALYFLDRALFTGNMDCTTHLKQVRKIAKQQFYARALLLKINNLMVQQQPAVIHP